MAAKIKFGTDGWRGVIAEDFTFDNVRLCAQAVANYLKKADSAEGGVVIGYDTRFASEDFAKAAAEVLAENGIKVLLCPKPAPTPVISYAVVETKAAGGIMITASHNPYLYNGFKCKNKYGTSTFREDYDKIEKEAARISLKNSKQLPIAEAVEEGLVDYYDPVPAYIKHIETENLADLQFLKQSQLKVIVDPMCGTGAGYISSLLQGGKIQVTEINNEHNPLFSGIQPEPIAKNLVKLAELVKEQKADVGIANDGDADRIGIIDEKGEFLTPQQVFALLTLYFLEVRGERGPIVKTVSSTDMLYRLAELFKVPVHEVHEVRVGFPYVAQKMLEKKALIGGEESGGFAYIRHLPERDGILAGLYFLDFMVKTGKTPSQLVDYLYSKVGPHYYDRFDFSFPIEKHREISDRVRRLSLKSIAGSNVVRTNTTDGARFVLADNSWLLIRVSGTEPLVRLYAESGSKENVRKILGSGKELLGL